MYGLIKQYNYLEILKILVFHFFTLLQQACGREVAASAFIFLDWLWLAIMDLSVSDE